MKHVLTLGCLILTMVPAAFAAQPAPVSRPQLQRYIWQEILNRGEEDPALKEIQAMVKNHRGDIRSLAKQLLKRDPGCCVHAIWYKEGTFLIVRLIRDTGIQRDFFMVQSYTPNEIRNAHGETVYDKKTETCKQITNSGQQKEIYQSLIPKGMVLLAEAEN